MATDAAAEPTAESTDEAPNAARKARIAKRMGEAGSDKRVARRKMVLKIYDLLIKTPEDEHGRVEGTPFSRTGVERLMGVLHSRAENTEEPVGRIAAKMIDFLSAEEDTAETISGVSVDKLQWIAKMGKRFKK